MSMSWAIVGYRSERMSKAHGGRDAGSSVAIGSRRHCPLPDPPAERGATFIVVDREHPGELARIPI